MGRWIITGQAGPPAAEVTAVTGDEVAGTRYPERGTRLVRAKFQAAVTLSAVQGLQEWTLWLSKDNGAHWVGIDWYLAAGTTGTATIDQVVPADDETWKFAAAKGRVPFDAGVLIADGAMPAGVVRQVAGFVVDGLAAPPAGLVTALIVPAGTGPSGFPYLRGPDPDNGYQDWCLPSIQFDATAAVAHPDARFATLVVRDLNTAGAAIGDWHPYGVMALGDTPGIREWGDLAGPYGDVAVPPRSGSIGKVELKLVLSSGKSEAQDAWDDPAVSTDQCTLVVEVAVGGALPPGSIPGDRVDGPVSEADSVPWGGVVGPINVGGGGSAHAIWEVKDAAGTVIAWVGKKTVSGTDYYGIWGKNVWIGGTDPTNPKAWIDGSGNFHLLGVIESGSSITVSTADGDVTISPSSGGIEVASGADAVTISPTLVSAYDGTYLSFLASDELSIKNGKFHVNSSAQLDVYNAIPLEGVGVPYIFDTASGSLSTSTTVDTTIVHGAGAPAGLYRISVKAVVTNFGSTGIAVFSYIASDGGVVGGGTILQQNFGAGQPQAASNSAVLYSNGGGIVLRVQTVGLAGGAAFNWYAVVERLT